MDDMLLYSSDPQLHQERTRKVLQHLKDNDLFLKLEKCTFDVPEVEFLGMIVGHNYVKMDPAKVEGILKWPTPTTVKQVRGFLGFGNFY